MSEKCFLGVDLGAESGRVIAGVWNGERMRLEELHRFQNGGVTVGGTLRWDLLRLWGEIERGLGVGAKRFGSSIVSVGVDTWGVDFALLSKSKELLGLPRHYRDARNPPALRKLTSAISRKEIFAASGVQSMPINTLCQLVAMKEENPELLDAAAHFLMIPDFLHWCLCGSLATEFTNATTTQFYHPRYQRWSIELLGKLGLPTEMLPEVVSAGHHLGQVMGSVRARTGLGDIAVVAPATHDTGSAVVAAPTARTGQLNWAYISSGTWSLLGVELDTPCLTLRALAANVTNEGGVDGSYRLLKNIMGLWLVQQCRRSFESNGTSVDYTTLIQKAAASIPFRAFIDPDDPRFLNPADMPAAIVEYCSESGQAVPEDEGQIIRCVLESLALKYARVFESLQDMTGAWFEMIHILGGGAGNWLLNQFTANACARTVFAGPMEATVLGNVLVQARAAGELGTLDDIRHVSWSSSEVKEFTPADLPAWREARERFSALLDR